MQTNNAMTIVPMMNDINELQSELKQDLKKNDKASRLFNRLTEGAQMIQTNVANTVTNINKQMDRNTEHLISSIQNEIIPQLKNIDDNDEQINEFINASNNIVALMVCTYYYHVLTS